ncbi:MAG: SLBB domain-containing protein [Terriglobia bacterium]|jgi:polysaccharide export outer membrane protein
MAGGVRGSWSSVRWLGRAGGRAPGRFHLRMVGLLLMAVGGLLCAPGASPAASEKANSPDNKADTKAGVDLGSQKAEETLIYPNDLLFIQVFDVDQMTREYRVSDTGTLLFPLLADPVQVAGLTPQQAAEVISQRCIEAGVLSRPQISVTIRESRVHAVAIAGAVKNPQIYPVLGRITLLDLLTQAGGVADDAGSTATITRGEVFRRVLASEGGGAVEGGKSLPIAPTVTIDLRRLQETGDPNLNVEVYPGDRVTVQRAGVVYVLGAVNRAGGYVLNEAHQDMTVLKAIALAGYLGPFAKGKKALILRPNSSAPGGREEIPVNLMAMLRGHAPDKAMQHNDILFVPDSTALKALHRAADIAATTSSYAAIYAIP